MTQEEVLKELGTTPYGKALSTYIDEEINKMRDSSSIQGTAAQMGNELIARRKAEIILKRILRMMLPEKKIKPRNQYL